MGSGRPFDPSSAVPGHWQRGIDASTLLSGQRTTLDVGRLQRQRELLVSGRERFDPIMVSPGGVILDGHHGARAAAEAGLAVDVIVIELPLSAGLPILQLPVV